MSSATADKATRRVFHQLLFFLSFFFPFCFGSSRRLYRRLIRVPRTQHETIDLLEWNPSMAVFNSAPFLIAKVATRGCRPSARATVAHWALLYSPSCWFPWRFKPSVSLLCTCLYASMCVCWCLFVCLTVRENPPHPSLGPSSSASTADRPLFLQRIETSIASMITTGLSVFQEQTWRVHPQRARLSVDSYII